MAVPATATAMHVFDDVDDAKFYAGPIEWALNNDITTGSPAGADTFKPEDPVTPGESVTFLKRYHDNIVQPGSRTSKPTSTLLLRCRHFTGRKSRPMEP